MRIQVFPPRSRSQKTKKKQASAPTAQPKEPQKKTAVERDWETILELLLELFDELRETLVIRMLQAHIIWGGKENPAQTGLLLGQSAALVGIAYPYLQDRFPVRRFHVELDADFEAESTKWNTKIDCSARPCMVLWVLLRNYKRLRQLHICIMGQQEEEAYERTSD